jgi:hypothetical protein
MSFIRERLIGTEQTFNDTNFVQLDLIGPIDLSTYAKTKHLETNPIHLMLHMIIVDEAQGIGMKFISHFTIAYNDSSYITAGTYYSLECPVYSETFNDGDFELQGEGVYFNFSGDDMTIRTSVRTPNGLTLTLNSYSEMYLNSNVQ